MFEQIRGLWIKQPNKTQKLTSAERFTAHKYASAGCTFGDIVSYSYMGDVVGAEGALANWEKWETKYANNGFRTISLDDFIEAGGYGEDISSLVGARRNSTEHLILHALRYKGLPTQTTLFDVQTLPHGGFVGKYVLPSTRD